MESDVLTSYDLVRLDDGVVVFTFDMPLNCKVLLYRQGDVFSFRPVYPSEIAGTPNLFMQMLERAGYRVSPISVILPLSA
ncbi:hypothetical protein [Kosakonia radicincitans]|uniref:hypothetical protein n=1 Tax=Kosakonia radicincitans TaxID=283686 RepID=UPI001D063284|nr:hypothetical protein [Kosakonia radicincitans]